MANKKKRRLQQDVTRDFIQAPAFQIKDVKLTDKQRELVRIFKHENCKVVFLSGPAGTAKTWASVFAGLLMMREGLFSKIKYIRAAVESSQSKMGFLPGMLGDKIAPFSGALDDKLEELLFSYDAEKLKREGSIEVLPPNFLRGTTFKDSFVIIDEAQQMCYSDLVTIISRIGEGSLLVFCYDPMQKDIKNSGIERLAKVFDDEESIQNGIYSFRFTSEDIMRSKILFYIMGKLEKAQ